MEINQGSIGLGDSRGCCPGQIEHHLIPDSWVKDKCGSNYSHADAPVVCMEGTSHSTGTHGEIHSGLNKVYDDTIEKRAGFLGGNNKYGIDSVIDMAVASHKQVYDIVTGQDSIGQMAATKSALRLN